MMDLKHLMLLKYINRKYYEVENDVIEVKNRMIARRAHAGDYADLAIALARQEAIYEVLQEVMLILQNWRT